MSTPRGPRSRPPARSPAHAAGRRSNWHAPRSAAARRRRRSLLVAVVVLVGLAAWLVASSGGPNPPKSPKSPASGAGGRQPSTHSTPSTVNGPGPSVVTTMARWHLPDALSRAGAAALPGGRILLLGGLLASGTSSAGVGIVQTSSGKLTPLSTLASPTHDAGAAALGARTFLFGGGATTPFATVESVTVSGAGSSGTGGAVTGQLPQVRADDEAVSLGGTAYVVGGYDGTTGDGAVLATRDGATFSTVATLPANVRYPAVAALDGMIFVFGGESAPGGTTSQFATPTGLTTPPPGQEVAVVQEIDPRAHTARVVGYLPHAVQGAAAFDLGGHLFLAGGDSNAPGSTPASGTTIWSFDPSTDVFHVAGHLAQPVAYAAVAVEGNTAWLVGGERDGVAVDTVQKVVLRSTH
jgi:hypothetical protein